MRTAIGFRMKDLNKLCDHIIDRSNSNRQDLRCSRPLGHNTQLFKHYHVIPIGWKNISEERNIKLRGVPYGQWNGVLG